MARTAEGLIIGNEVLSAKVEDANGPYLARVLRVNGIELRRLTVVPDEVEVIAEVLRERRAAADVVFTSGGIGPTHDDVTVRAVARALDREVVRDPQMEELVRRHSGARMSAETLRLADAPAGARFHDAPGLWLPVMVVENVVLLPGIPELFRRQLDAVVGQFRDAPFALRALFLSTHEDEIAAVLDAVVARHPGVAIGSYPVIRADYRVKLTVEGRDPELVERALADLQASLPAGSVLWLE